MTAHLPPTGVPQEMVQLLIRVEAIDANTRHTASGVDRIEKHMAGLEHRTTALETWRTEIDTRMSSVGWFSKGLTAILGGGVAVFGQLIVSKLWG